MNNGGYSASHERSTTVVADAAAARQWELHLAAAQLQQKASGWLTPPLVTYGGWLERLWLDHHDGQPPPLAPPQSRALWRRVIAESEEGAALIGQAGVADWAGAAWELLHRWRIDPRAERAAAEQLDYRAMLVWCRGYRERLDANGWVDRAELEGKLAVPRVEGRVVMTDLGDPYPARTELLARAATAGASIEYRAAPDVGGTQRTVRLADAADELRAAFFWARERLLAKPESRVAVVVAGLAARQAEVGRLLASFTAQGPPCAAWSSGQSLAADPAVGAAVTALKLLTPGTSYAAFGRFLRSRYFAAAPLEQSARAQLDAQLRTELRAQLSFAAAYRQCGLAESFEQLAPQSAAALAEGLAVVGQLRCATPSRWAYLWTRFLERLHWLAPSAVATVRAWQASLDDLARLTPVLGEVTIGAALLELERLLDRPSSTAMPLYGLHVFGRIDEIGPGYEGVWATGFTDAFWPEAPQGNPLLPRALQRAHGMPRSSPQDARDRSARSLARLVKRVPELIASWPARVYDYETEPSPAIRDWPRLPDDETAILVGDRQRRRVARETLEDPAPPLVGRTLRGGAGLLGRQARCPLHAFCYDRLGARPLEMLGFGLPRRLRGIAVHHALEALLSDLPSQAQLTDITRAARSQTAEQALSRVFKRTRRSLQALFELEVEQLEELLGAWLSSESARAPFDVVAVEQRRDVQLGQWTLQVRLDRLDRLADGSHAVIDYKTGSRATSADWFTPRLRDAQVPLYAIQSPERIGAAVIARLRPGDTSYSGLWPDGAFPGRASNRASDWSRQLEHWRVDLEQLAAEFAAGDTRVFVDRADDALGLYAPLTRFVEQLALRRGSIPGW